MARPLRLVAPGQPHHIIQRGNNKAPSFHSAEDYANYLGVLRDASVRTRCAIHAYVLMSNHAHLLVTPADDDGPSRMMQMIGRRYVRYFNDRHGRTGTLWEGRYRSSLIDSERYFFACSRYIELNPVRANIVKSPAEYRWSSHRGNALGHLDAVLTNHPLLDALGRSPGDRRAAYAEMFTEELEGSVAAAIRRATNVGATLGTDNAVNDWQRRTGKRVWRRQYESDPRSFALTGSVEVSR